MNGQQRKVLMVIDNYPAHPKVQNLKATEMLFLPPNATSRLQPCDQGIIQNLKVHHRSTMLSRLVQHIDAGSNATDLSATLLDYVSMLKSTWDKVVAATIANCFCTAGFKDEATPSDNPMTAAGEIMQPLLERLYREMKISMSDVVNMDSDLETTATPTDAEIVGLPSCALSTSDESENEDNCEDELEGVTQSEVTSTSCKLIVTNV